ncbi:MAG: hypothetical protein FJY07_12505 [Bacteroidetes bacterium]|nr:hypothetical protein [Bacteroidota bacterium]
MTRQDKRAMMLTLVEQWQQSGLSQRKFVRVQNMTLVKLRYWIRRWRQSENNTSGFIQLNSYSDQDISICYPNGVELMLPVQTPVGYIESLINY